MTRRSPSSALFISPTHTHRDRKRDKLPSTNRPHLPRRHLSRILCSLLLLLLLGLLSAVPLYSSHSATSLYCLCQRRCRRSAHVRMTNDRNLRQFFFPFRCILFHSSLFLLLYFAAAFNYFLVYISLEYLLLSTSDCGCVCVCVVIIG